MRSTRLFGIGALSAVALLGSALAGSAQAVGPVPGETNPRDNGPAFRDNDARFELNIENAVIVICNNGSNDDDGLGTGDGVSENAPTANGSPSDAQVTPVDVNEIYVLCSREETP